MMHGLRPSDSPIVPVNAPNKAGYAAAEGRERRGLTKEKLDRHNRPIGHSTASGMLSVLVQIRHVTSVATWRQHPRYGPDSVVPLVRIRAGGVP
jgi:hypothetical protein